MKEHNDFDIHTDLKKAYSPETKNVFLKYFEFFDDLIYSLLYLENGLAFRVRVEV